MRLSVKPPPKMAQKTVNNIKNSIMAKENESELLEQTKTRMFTIMEAADYLRISRASIFRLISNGRLKVIKFSPRMTRITLDELLKLAETSGYEVIMPDGQARTTKKPETGRVNKAAKCRKTPASATAPEGVTHDTHYTMAEVQSKFCIKYGRLYEVRNRYQLESVHAWGTTCFKKEDVEDAISKYNEEQGRGLSEAYYTCFDIMQLFGLGKTQVRRFALTHGVRTRKVQNGQAYLYLKADWDAARKQAEAKSPCTKAKRK